MAIAVKSIENYNIIAYVELPTWLVTKLTGASKRTRRDDFVAVVGETEKAYKIAYVTDTSMSYDFINLSWMIDYVAKSLVKSIRYDVERYEQEEIEYYEKLRRKTMRITKQEIESTIEMFANSIYDEGAYSSWLTASFQDWQNAVYEELITWKTEECWSYYSNENRFDGKENIMKRIKPLLIARLKELKEEGYAIKAI